MSDEDEAGSDKVTACTRAFEEIDAQVFSGPGRGATPSEAAASDRWGGPSAATVEAYRRMFGVVVKHQRAHSEPRAGMSAGHRPRRTPEPASGGAPTPARRSRRPTSSTGVPSLSGAASDLVR
jgi:hypothetical protein